jgi:hypothetical protein
VRRATPAHSTRNSTARVRKWVSNRWLTLGGQQVSCQNNGRQTVKRDHAVLAVLTAAFLMALATMLVSSIPPSGAAVAASSQIPDVLIAPIRSGTPACVITRTGDLMDEIRTLGGSMPGGGSNGMITPTVTQMSAWETVPVERVCNAFEVHLSAVVRDDTAPSERLGKPLLSSPAPLIERKHGRISKAGYRR